MSQATRLQAALADQVRLFDPDIDIGRATPPPASWYTDPAFLELERHTTFSRHWQFVGRVDQVVEPGDFFTGVVLKRPFVVVRDEDHTLRAFYNVCAHHGTRVVSGSGCAREFTCPYHGWQYQLCGALKRTPRAGAIEELERRTVGLQPIPLRTVGPFVLLHFGVPSASGVMDRLDVEKDALALDSMRFVARRVFELDCNWKVFVDNYLDGGYHVPHMHRDLSASLEIGDYASRLDDGYSVQSCPTKGDAKRLGDHATYLWVHPNFMINRYGPWMDTNLVLPIDARRCSVVFDYYHDGAVDGDLLDRELRDSETVQREDAEIVTRVQEGLESGVYEGLYAPRFEAPMLHFHRMLAADFSGTRAI